MRVRSVFFLVRVSLRGKRLRCAAVIAGLAVGMLALGLAMAGGWGTARSLRRHLESLYPEQRVVLRAKTVEAFAFQAETTIITPETAAAVAALPGVVRVSPEATARFPLSARGSLMGKTYSTDMTVTGIEPWLLGEEAPDGFVYDPAPDAAVPAVFSNYFLDLYNIALAESNHLPQLTPAAVVGRHLDLILGESTLQEPDPARQTKVVPARLVGLTRNPDLLGLLLPLEAVEAFNAWYGIPDKRYRQLHVELASSDAAEALLPGIDRLGLQMLDRMAAWRKALTVVHLVAAAFVGLGILVFALALAYLASTITWMLSERRRELALFRALGASPRQVVALLVSEAGAISFLGIALGLVLAIAGLGCGNEVYAQWRAERAFLPETLFAAPWWWTALLGLGCWTLAMMLSLAQVLANTGRPISTALSKNE